MNHGIVKLTGEQYKWLTGQLPPARIAKLRKAGMDLAHVEAHYVKAALTYVFGFGMWSDQILRGPELVFEEKREDSKWDVSYRCELRLTCKDSNGVMLGPWDDGAIDSSVQGSRAEAHDMAYKGAISGALKRCAAKALGNQFGLSLYLGRDDEGHPFRSILPATLSGVPLATMEETEDSDADGSAQ